MHTCLCLAVPLIGASAGDVWLECPPWALPALDVESPFCFRAFLLFWEGFADEVVKHIACVAACGYGFSSAMFAKCYCLIGM